MHLRAMYLANKFWISSKVIQCAMGLVRRFWAIPIGLACKKSVQANPLRQGALFATTAKEPDERLFGSEHPVASVTQTGNNITVIVQVTVECGRDNRHIGMRLLHSGNTLWGCE